MNILTKLSFIGTGFHGFQYQPLHRTVQGELTKICSEALGTEIDVKGCSRTDSGVHALGYYVLLSPADKNLSLTEIIGIPTEKIHRVLNRYLPGDIRVLGACEVGEDFHPRYNVLSKEYRYYIFDGIADSPFYAPYTMRLKYHLSDDDIQHMNDFSSLLTGRHDFSSFMASGSDIGDTTRNLMKLETVRENENTVCVTARADGFLYNMVRILTGTLLDAAAGKINCDDAEKLLNGNNRDLAGFTAPPEGLFLYDVEFDRKTEIRAE